MEFRTQIPIQKQKDNLINYHSNIMLLGSCFSENIGCKFEYYKFKNTVNPFGILFHPKAIEVFLERVVNQRIYLEDDLVFQNEQYHCFDSHSSLSNSNKNVLLNDLNEILKTVYLEIIKSSHLIITLGTAWVYKYIEQNKVVANCHKIPQKEFTKQLLSVSEITNSLKNIEVLVRKLNSSVKIIYTVSPVRHLKDGFIENQQSKSNLLSAIHVYLLKSKSSYFPSYEIMMDDLRDYRFYKTDMLHPNQVAIDYIWEQFQIAWFLDNTKPIMKKVTTIQKGMAHKPFNISSEAHISFLNKLEHKKEELLKDYPNMIF